MFIGRERELKKLNELYSGDKFECVIIYGRRRVGKTTLIQEFIKDKKSIYFLSLETRERINLENLSRGILSVAIENVNNPPSFANFADAFAMVGDLAANERIILVIDEYPYLANSVQGISSIIQAQIDMRLKNTKLLMILCGSSMSFMENQVLGYQSPLYGRRTAQFKIQPFTFFESLRFYQNYNPYDNAVIYGITGGIPQYLARIDDKKTLRENIINNFFEPSSYLYEEPSNLLKQELREPQTYNEIITAIATGSSRLNEISTKIGLNTAVCSKYLASLISLGIVKKERPVLDEKSKRTIYRLEDNMFRFWYRFVPTNASLINSGAGAKAYENIEQHIPHYMGEVFEEICKQYMWRENIAERLPFYFREAGRWWGANPIKKSEQEIDIIAYDDTRAVFCECKWWNEPVAKNILNNLIEKSMIFGYREKYYFIFSKSGYMEDFLQSVEHTKNARQNIRLIDFKNMLN